MTDSYTGKFAPEFDIKLSAANGRLEGKTYQGMIH
jgi:hypothetical protein